MSSDDLEVRLGDAPDDGCSQVLPVDLIAFTGSCEDDKAVLKWEVASEQNILNYQIERSFDGVNWVIVGSEAPLNSEQSKTDYTHKTWENLSGRAAYFRLNIFEMNGSAEYSHIISVKCKHETPIINVFPNPSMGDHFKIYLDNPASAKVSIKVENMLGQSVYHKEVQLEEGEHQLLVDEINWASGIYSLTIDTKVWRWSKKLVIE